MLAFIGTATAGLFVAGTYKTFGGGYFDSDRYLASVGSASSAANLLGRVAWGALSDRAGWRASLAALSAAATCLLLTYAAVARARSRALFALWTCGILFCYGGNFALYPAATAHLFGRARAGLNYGAVFLVYGSVSASCLFVLESLSASPALNYVLAGVQGFGTLAVLALASCAPRSAEEPRSLGGSS